MKEDVGRLVRERYLWRFVAGILLILLFSYIVQIASVNLEHFMFILIFVYLIIVIVLEIRRVTFNRYAERVQQIDTVLTQKDAIAQKQKEKELKEKEVAEDNELLEKTPGASIRTKKSPLVVTTKTKKDSSYKKSEKNV